MPPSHQPELWFLLAAAAAVVILRFKADRRHIKQLQRRATAEIQQLQVESQDPRLQLLGRTATVEHREEIGGTRGLFEKVADLAVTAHLVNEHGERFLVKWHSKSTDAPYVKHLPAKPSHGAAGKSAPEAKGEA